MISAFGYVPRQQRGLSLVELLVAMVIGIVILLAASEVMVSNNRTRGEIERTGRQIENGIFALQLLEDDISNAGFWGEANVAASGGLPPLCPTTSAELQSAMGYPLQAAVVGGATCAVSIKDDSESIALRRASTCALGTANCQAFGVNAPYIQVPACITGTDMGEVTFNDGEASIGELQTSLNGQRIDCATRAPIYRYISRIYYVTSDDELARMDFGAGAYAASGALVEGIEALSFSYGIDSDVDGQVDSYTSTPTATESRNIASVRLWLVARNLTPTPGYSDERTYSLGDVEHEVPEAFVGHKRQVYSTTITLRNVAGAREVQ
jgi:type IV pilus assembly protein PilW